MTTQDSNEDAFINGWTADPPAQGVTNITHVETVDVPDNHVAITKAQLLFLWCAVCFLLGFVAMSVVLAVTN